MLRHLLRPPAVFLALVWSAWAADLPAYELSGSITPPFGGRVSLFSASEPYSASTLADVSGHFHFKQVRPGIYTISILSRRRGEARRTVDVTPGLADRKGRIPLKLNLSDSDFSFAAVMSRQLVSKRQLGIPESARRDYERAQNELSRRRVDAAVAHLQRAVERAPAFAPAWNTLGVIAYQTRSFDRAEECFRKAVGADPDSFESLVNLGGVMVTEHKLDEAMQYNLKAVLRRPNDALANAQLGVTYYLLAQYELATKYLEKTRQLDPASFTYPQLMLFEIHYRNGDRERAASDLEEFLRHHPDWPQAPAMRQTIASFRKVPSR
ncbi:MAG: tetratricopeptide repeat protein [Acidobacteriia bacterium]|nr:tetratricopeptide repeat protein [Terriglobia bacterium]